MTEVETLQAGRDLIATEIMGYSRGPVENWYRRGDELFKCLQPDTNAEQSLAVKRKLNELGWSVHIDAWKTVGCWMEHDKTKYSVLGIEDKDELMAIFKACVKAAEFLRDNQEEAE